MARPKRGSKSLLQRTYRLAEAETGPKRSEWGLVLCNKVYYYKEVGNAQSDDDVSTLVEIDVEQWTTMERFLGLPPGRILMDGRRAKNPPVWFVNNR
jgi:hypothetical protein